MVPINEHPGQKERNMEKHRPEAILSFTFKKLEEMLEETRRKHEAAGSPGRNEQPKAQTFCSCRMPVHLNPERS